MAEFDDDLLEGVQGRWQTAEGDFVVVEADQVWFLGDTAIYGNISVEKVEGRVVVTFTPTESKDEATTGSFSDGDKSLIWADGDVWKKLQPGENAGTATAVTSGKGHQIGRLSHSCTVELDEEGQERRWTKNGQLGSRQDMNS